MGSPAEPERYAAWCKPVDDVLGDFEVNAADGLEPEEVKARAEQYGLNELQKEADTPLWKLVLEQFDDALVKMLLAAACISFVMAFFEEESKEAGLRAYVEPFVILLILVLNAVVGVWQEANAESALDALKQMQPATAKVVRGSSLVGDLPARELVPGDIVRLSVGDKVPADCRIVQINTATLRAEQASLTGESVAVSKIAEACGTSDSELQGQESMLFSGTAIANGNCSAVVTCIGMSTEMGRIQADITAAAAEDADTPLKKKLNQFGEQLARVIAIICILVWAINYHHFMSWETTKSGLPDLSTVSFSFRKCTYYFKIAVALAVAAIPEGLPAVITTCLALGTRKMAAHNAIIRRLPSVETLGCTTVICSDKTGTLTTNMMSVARVITASKDALRTITVSGSSFNPDDGAVDGIEDSTSLDVSLDVLADVCALCNQATLAASRDASALPSRADANHSASGNGIDGGSEGKVTHRCIGEPTEGALVVLSEKLGAQSRRDNRAAVSARRSDPESNAMPVTDARRMQRAVLATLEFDRTRKSMSVVVPGSSATAGNELMVKGAAECVLARCNQVLLPTGATAPLDAARRKAIDAAVGDMATHALRCLACATRSLKDSKLGAFDGTHDHPAFAQLQDLSKYEEIESGLTFVGLVGLQDPPRPEVAQAVAQCALAGIRIVVITGDNKDTAEAICKAIGVFGMGQDLSQVSLTGRAFAQLPPAAQTAALAAGGSLCISRAEPRDKQDVVRQLKALYEVVAMTGDGVNDAPALKLADIGIAMGITGTEVAKEASDMVLADDNFSTIVAAVREGRSIFDNMKAFIRYMISSNIGEVFSIFFTAALGMPEGLIPVQLLWVNLVTDGPPATALGFNPPDHGVMRRRPRDPQEALITPWVFLRYFIVGAYVGLATVGIFAVWYTTDSFFGIHVTADGHTPVTFAQLRDWEACPRWAPESDFAPARSFTTAGGGAITFAAPCDYFTAGKVKACTLSLTVLVAIEMLNSLNALSEDGSLVQMPPWANPYLLAAMALSFALHFLILYVPPLAAVFSIVPLTGSEWLLVLLFASPVLLIDEVLKFVGRTFVNPPRTIEALSADEDTGKDKDA